MSNCKRLLRHGLLVVLIACGGSAGTAGTPGDPPKGDAAADAPPIFVSCSDVRTAGGACATEGECCAQPIPDGVDADWYRCVSKKWAHDMKCAIDVCPSPVDGTVQRADGRALRLYCLDSTTPGSENAPPGFTVSIAMRDGERNGGELTLRFADRPSAGTTYELGRDGELSDAGAALVVRIGGGLAGSTDLAHASSGKLTVSSVTAVGKISELHGSITAEMQPAGSSTSSPWQGTLVATW